MFHSPINTQQSFHFRMHTQNMELSVLLQHTYIAVLPPRSRSWLEPFIHGYLVNGRLFCPGGPIIRSYKGKTHLFRDGARNLNKLKSFGIFLESFCRIQSTTTTTNNHIHYHCFFENMTLTTLWNLWLLLFYGHVCSHFKGSRLKVF